MSSPSSSTYNLVSTHYTTHVTSQTPSSQPRNALVAEAFGYSAADLASIPASANLGVSCGNPLATAGLKEVHHINNNGYFHYLASFGRAVADGEM